MFHFLYKDIIKKNQTLYQYKGNANITRKCYENAVLGPLHCDRHEKKNVIYVWDSQGAFQTVLVLQKVTFFFTKIQSAKLVLIIPSYSENP